MIQLLLLSFLGTLVVGQELRVGMKVGDWALKDIAGKSKNLKNWNGKVLLINYLDPDHSEMNEHLTTAFAEALKEGVLKAENCAGMGIIDCDSTWKPMALIKMVVKRKEEELRESNSSILFDNHAEIRKKWGLRKDSSNLVILDKNRVCRAIVRGKVPQRQLASLIHLVSDLQYQ